MARMVRVSTFIRIHICIGWLLRGVDGATRRAPYARLPPHGTRWPRTGQGRGGAADGRHPPVAHLSQGLRPGVPLACVAPGCHARGDTRCGAYVPVSRCLGVPVSRCPGAAREVLSVQSDGIRESETISPAPAAAPSNFGGCFLIAPWPSAPAAPRLTSAPAWVSRDSGTSSPRAAAGCRWNRSLGNGLLSTRPSG